MRLDLGSVFPTIRIVPVGVSRAEAAVSLTRRLRARRVVAPKREVVAPGFQIHPAGAGAALPRTRSGARPNHGRWALERGAVGAAAGDGAADDADPCRPRCVPDQLP